jgi:proteic killer suppression protein
MIRRFRHKGLERFFTGGDSGGINAQQALRLRRLLTSLSIATGPEGMNLPGYRLHQLRGDRRGQRSMSTSSIITERRKGT